MVRWWGAGVAVALTVTLVWLGAGPSEEQPGGPTVAAAVAQDDEREDDDESSTEKRGDRGREASAGHGPPPWAKGPGGDAAGDKRAWHSAWTAMSPRQREQTMARLSESHASGMRSWAQCVADGRDDCEKPVPPGLAKKQLRP